MSLDKYKLDKAFTEGVDIRLDDSPEDVFRVKLPSQYNRGYTQAMYSAMDWSYDDDGKVRTGGNLMGTRFAQEDAFIKFCLVSLNGEPLPDGFADEFPRAVTELISKAQDLANEIEERVSDSTKKSSASSAGKESGLEKSGSTSDLKKAVS